MKNTHAIRIELAILIKSKIANKEHDPVQKARQEINLKYGKGWREQGIEEYNPNKKYSKANSKKSNNKYQEPSIYDDHIFGEFWMD
jgi:hypothetical protein